jgi:hypothetical protein
LKPGWLTWFANMTPDELLEHRAKLSAGPRAAGVGKWMKSTWAKRSKTVRAKMAAHRARAGWAKLTPEQHRAKMDALTAASAARPHEEHVAVALRVPREVRSARARAAWAQRSPEVRSANAKKSAETRRKNIRRTADLTRASKEE